MFNYCNNLFQSHLLFKHILIKWIFIIRYRNCFFLNQFVIRTNKTIINKDVLKCNRCKFSFLFVTLHAKFYPCSHIVHLQFNKCIYTNTTLMVYIRIVSLCCIIIAYTQINILQIFDIRNKYTTKLDLLKSDC